MIQVPSHGLPEDVLAELAGFQQEIDAFLTYPERVKAALDQWPVKRRRVLFERIEAVLGVMCSGPRRCMFCEDNGAYQIEHFRPKTLYPGLVFAWANYLYACGQCNGPKSNPFAVFSEVGTVLVILEPEDEPAPGPPVLLDPRQDDPMAYLWLDLRDTFRFKEIHPEGTAEHSRAKITIDWLGLNERDDLVEARSTAYDDFRARLVEYASKKNAGCTQDVLNRLRGALLRKNHMTVWREMQRQSQLIGELSELFAAVPEALSW